MVSPIRSRNPWLAAIFLLASVLVLAGCGGSSDNTLNATQGTAHHQPNNRQNDSSQNGDSITAPRVPVTKNRPGRVYAQKIHVEATGDTLVVTVMEPTHLKVGHTYPLVLHGHGYAGHRSRHPDAFQQKLRDHGYYVISISQRGFGKSTGTVRVMSPDYAGKDLVALLNWAENLPGLARYPNGKMKVGSYGGSYGGMYQYILAGTDPKNRLTVIAPNITPYNLAYSLAPHGVPKTGWVLLLATAGEASPLLNLFQQPSIASLLELLKKKQNHLTNQDLTIVESLLRGGLTDHLPDATMHMLRYHSLAYFCAGKPSKSQRGFILGKPDPRTVKANGLPEIDALITQGFRDSLFDFNEAHRAYQCLNQLGGDVRLLSHQSGHIVPLSVQTVPGLGKLANKLSPILRVPGFQEQAGSDDCGPIKLQKARFAWFQAKLKGKEYALEKALPTGQLICLSIADHDAIATKNVKVGGKAFKIHTNTPALSGPVGLLTSLLGTIPRQALLQTQTIFTAPENQTTVIAGIPQLNVDITSLFGKNLGLKECPKLPLDKVLGSVPDIPLTKNLLQGVADIVNSPLLPVSCDPVYFLALAQRAPGQQAWDIIDGQVTPIRGYGHHKINMNGIAVRLSPGDQVALVILGFHLQYPISFSRDLVTIAAKVNGTVELPILSPNNYRDL